MAPKTLYWVTFAGFCLLYLATMGSIVVLAMEPVEAYRPFIFKFLLLPAGIAGTLLIWIEKHSTAADRRAKK